MMKKYLLTALAAIAAILFSTCSNDDITINRKFTIAVDASGVTAAFKDIDLSQGVNGISSVTDGFRLRVRMLVYDSEGKAIFKEQQYRSSYLENGTPFSTELENGMYTFVAITDVVPPSSSIIESIWTLTEESDINKAVLTFNSDVNSIGNNIGKYSILGVHRQQVTITDETQNVILQPQPVGALVRVIFTGMHTADSNGYRLFSMRTNYTPKTVDYKGDKVSTTSEMSEYNSHGQMTRNGLDYTINTAMEGSDNETAGYLFFLPCEINCRFAYIKQDNSNGWCGPVLSFTLEAGIGYDAKLDLRASSNVVDENSVATFTQSSASEASQAAPVRSIHLADIQ